MKPKLAIVIASLVAAGAILYFALGKKPQRDEVADALTVMTGFRDRMCGCRDQPCIAKIRRQMASWAQGYVGAQAVTPTELESEKLAAIAEEIAKCAARVGNAPGPSGSAAADVPAGAGSS